MRAWSLYRKPSERGSALVEFTLILIPLLAIIFLTANLAWIIFGWASLQEGVREGVRFGVTGQILPPNTGLDASIQQVVQQHSSGFLNSDNSPSISVQYFSPTTLTNVTGQTGATDGGNVVKVKASMSMKLLVPVWKSNGFSRLSLNLAAASSDVMEGSPGGVAPSE